MRGHSIRAILGVAAACLALPAAAQVAPAPLAVALENDYVRVTRDAAPCASAAAGTCEDRVILAMGEITLVANDARRTLARGQVAIFKAGESYAPPTGSYFEVAIKPRHPPVKSPSEMIAPVNNLLTFDGAHFFIYEERLDVGATRPRHSHSQRVEIRLNNGPMLRQSVWVGSETRQIEPSIVNWREPVTHEVTNIGDMPLRNFILEFKPEGATAAK